ncbi:MAG: hypothetical protein H6Q65_326 [Firmicutes bacterium]|nr:hypothetical protein [Bacillota bacterium]
MNICELEGDDCEKRIIEDGLYTLFTGSFICSIGLTSAEAATLNVYGPGGPLGPMQECAQLFAQMKGITVNVTAGPESKWIEKANQDADLIFGGAEYMLTDFTLRHPGFVDNFTRTSLYDRASGILVRKGNPKNIHTLQDLARKDITIIDVNGAGQVGLWEDLAGVRDLLPAIQNNIAISVSTSAEAIELWKNQPIFDAWITYESWYYRLQDVTDLVKLPETEKLYRGTPISVTYRSTNRELALQFIQFLKSETGHAVFQKWGWK